MGGDPPGRNDAVDLGSFCSGREDNEDDENVVEPADDPPPVFVVGTRVREKERERVGKDPACRLEVEAVLAEVGSVLGLVPLEGHE
jgi:hypothetical protein